MNNRAAYLAHATLFVLLATCPSAAQDQPQLRVKTEKLTDNLYLIRGAGGNVAVSVGDNGVLLVDSGYAELIDDVIAAAAELSEMPIRCVINTHWHFDHVGGNEKIGETRAAIIAHENVRKRMSSEQKLQALQRTVPPSPAKALPVLTFTESATLYFNGDAVTITHIDPAHTDGDSLVQFPNANALHVGDIWFNGIYPFIDVDAGGSIDGMIAAVDRILGIVKDDTRIIPGHGPLGSSAELRKYREMLVNVRANVQKLIDAGKTLEEVIAANPTAEFDADWGKGGMSPEIFTTIVYNGMKK